MHNVAAATGPEKNRLAARYFPRTSTKSEQWRAGADGGTGEVDSGCGGNGNVKAGGPGPAAR